MLCLSGFELYSRWVKFINQKLKKTANSQRARTPVFLVYFLQKAKANNKSVTLTLAPPASIIMPTKIP